MMSTEKILSAVAACRALIVARYPSAQPSPVDAFTTAQAPAAHALHMCDTIPKLHDREKVMRWLGFLQGMIVSGGYATLAECKKMNMPDEIPPAIVGEAVPALAHEDQGTAHEKTRAF